MTWDSSYDNINPDPLLTNVMGDYVKAVRLYKCPSDKFVSPANPGPRLRSVSMNGALSSSGSGPTVQGTAPGNRTYYGSGSAGTGKAARKTSDLITPGPARIFVVLDEQADSMSIVNGDATFMHDPGYAQGSERWRDLPASYHNGAGSFSFADGHSEIHRWLERSGNNRTTYPVTMGNYGSNPPWRNNILISRDYEWVQDRMPYSQ